MSDLRKAVQAMHHAAEQYDVSVLAIVLEDEEEAIVAASDAKDLLLAQELIDSTVENIPEEFLEDNGNSKENHYLNLLNDTFPKLYQTMPDSVKESFKERFHGKSEKYQEKQFEKVFNILKVMNTIMT